MDHKVTSINPANGRIIWETDSASANEVNQAFLAAKQALISWANLSFAKRAAFVESFAKQVSERQAELIERISMETGKPLWEAKTEANAVIGKVKLSIQAYQERTAEIKTPTAEATSCLRYKPHGVVAVLGPFNFPAHLSNGHIVPALLAGNTVIYKPSELSSFVAEFIMQCWKESGIPEGVIHCVYGAADTAQALLQQDLQAVYFTGSYKTGVAIHQQFATRPEILLALEMGGNNPLIIDDEIENMDAAIYNTLLSALITAGQRCTCARRVFIPKSYTGDVFLERLVKAYQSISVGPYSNTPEPFIGPVIRPSHALKHLEAQASLIELGGLAPLKMTLLAENTGFLSPGLIDMTAVNTPPDREIFAPLTQFYRYDDFEQALFLANQTQYGLAAGLISDNRNHYQQFYQTIRAGLINWNKPTTGAASNLPFGGIGHSGNHRPSAYFAADYCAYPIASQEQEKLTLPQEFLPGIPRI